MAAVKLAIPGQLLGPSAEHIAGPGTHVYDANIYASIAGPVQRYPTGAASSTSKGSSKTTLTVGRHATTAQNAPSSDTAHLPVVGSSVLCIVTRVQVRQAVCLILAVLPSAAASSIDSNPSFTNSTFPPTEALNFPALLRREDVRLTEKDRVVMNDSVRVGDFIRAQIISIGDERQYYISTAGNEFGVLAAKAEGDGAHAGGWMTGISWKEMRDLKAGNVRGESRKVAKPS